MAEKKCNPCDKCNPEIDWNGNCECSYCPHSSSGKINLNERMHGGA